MTQITTEPRYFEHEGGTKFYEVIEFWNVEAGRFVLVKRWGKLNAVGETQCETHTSMRACNAAAEKLIKSKMARGYLRKSSAEGLHGRGRAFDSGSKTRDGFRSAVLLHYSSTAFTNELTGLLGLMDKLVGMTADMIVVDELGDDIVVEEPGPEPDRGESWATW